MVAAPVCVPDLPANGRELRAAVAAATGCDDPALSVGRSSYTTSFPLYEVRAETPTGTWRFVLKDLRWSSLAPAARRAERREGHDPRRELATYRHLLHALDGPPRLHAGVAEPRSGRGWLLLEHVTGGRELYQWGELDAWIRAASWLAGFHRHWADPGRRATAARRVPLLRHDLGHLRRLGARAAARHPDLPDAVRDAWERAASHLAATPRTIIHGECYASDVLVDERGRVAVVDWETTATGSGWEDLAALSTGWDDASRSAMLDAYLSGLPAALRPPDPQATLDAARLAVCLQWLGADPGWIPPSEHRRDWMAEALAVCGARGGRW